MILAWMGRMCDLNGCLPVSALSLLKLLMFGVFCVLIWPSCQGEQRTPFSAAQVVRYGCVTALASKR